MVPAVVVVACGVNATQALILSQIVLSLILPLPMVALLVLGSRRSVMGSWTTRPLTNAVAIVACVLVLALNVLLLLQTAGIPIPFLG
jgi:manganese transport protein